MTRAIGCQGKPTWSPKQLSPAIAAIPRTSPLASFSVCTAKQITRFKLDDRAGARQHCWRGRQAEAESSRPQSRCGPFHMTNIKPTCGLVQIVKTNWVEKGGLPQKSICACARALDCSYITRASLKGRAQPLRKRKVEGINRTASYTEPLDGWIAGACLIERLMRSPPFCSRVRSSKTF